MRRERKVEASLRNIGKEGCSLLSIKSMALVSKEEGVESGFYIRRLTGLSLPVKLIQNVMEDLRNILASGGDRRGPVR